MGLAMNESSGNRWPWWARWLEPHRGSVKSRLLVRCSCGRLMWLDSSQEVLRLHVGHRMEAAQKGSMWEFAKMKLGWLDRLTVRERLQQRGWL